MHFCIDSRVLFPVLHSFIHLFLSVNAASEQTHELQQQQTPLTLVMMSQWEKWGSTSSVWLTYSNNILKIRSAGQVFQVERISKTKVSHRGQPIYLPACLHAIWLWHFNYWSLGDKPDMVQGSLSFTRISCGCIRSQWCGCWYVLRSALPVCGVFRDVCSPSACHLEILKSEII